MQKILKFAGMGLLLLVAAAFAGFYFFLGAVLKRGVETFGPKITQTEVKVGMVGISPLGGRGKIRNLVVGNPAGFRTESAMKLGRLDVEVVPRSLFSDTIHVRRVWIIGPEITYESTNAGNNLDQLQRNATQFQGKPAEQPRAGSRGKAKKIIIDDLWIRDGKLNYAPQVLGGKVVALDLPEIRLKDIGRASNGIPPSRAAAEVIRSLNGSASAAARGAAREVTETLEKSGQSIQGNAREMGGKIKSLFGK